MKSKMDRIEIDSLNPLKKDKTPRIKFIVRMTKELKKELEKAAKQHSKVRGNHVSQNTLAVNYFCKGLQGDVVYKKIS